MFEILLDDISLSFVGVADDASVKAARKCMDANGDNWVSEWLKIRKVSNDWIDYYEFLKTKMLRKLNETKIEQTLKKEGYIDSDSYKNQIASFDSEFSILLNRVNKENIIGASL